MTNDLNDALTFLAQRSKTVYEEYNIPGDFETLNAFISWSADRIVSSKVIVNITGTLQEPDEVVLTHPFNVNNLQLKGASLTSLQIQSIGTVTGSSKNWSVPLNLADASSVSSGDWLRISHLDISGTGQFKEIAGVWQVASVSGNTVTITHHHYATSWPTMTVSGPIKKYNAVLSFPNGARGIVVESGCQIDNLHWHQDWDPSTDTASDHADDGFQIGSAADTTTTGLTQSERVHGASVRTSLCSCSNFPGNGVQSIASTEISVGFMACSNGHRGHQAAEGAATYNYAGVSAANAASNYEAERGGVLTIPSIAAYGGGQQNLYALSNATIQETNGFLASAGTNSIDARKGAFIDKTNGDNNVGSGAGVYCDNARIELDNCTTLGGATGWQCRNGGFIDGHSASEPTSTTSYDDDGNSNAIIIRHDGTMGATGDIVADSVDANTLILNSSGGGAAKHVLTSVGDYIIQLSNGSSFSSQWIMKRNGPLYPASTSISLGRSSNPVSKGYFGDLNLSGLPTSSAGLSSGDVWNDGGILKIA